MIHLSQFGSAAFAKNVVARAGVGRNEVAHILDDAENGNSYGFEHAQRAAYVSNCYILRRGH